MLQIFLFIYTRDFSAQVYAAVFLFRLEHLSVNGNRLSALKIRNFKFQWATFGFLGKKEWPGKQYAVGISWLSVHFMIKYINCTFQEDEPIYIAVKGVVFDVTSGKGKNHITSRMFPPFSMVHNKKYQYISVFSPQPDGPFKEQGQLPKDMLKRCSSHLWMLLVF